MKKALIVVSIATTILGLLALTGVIESVLFPILANRIGRMPTSNTSNHIHSIGWIFLFCSLIIWLFIWLVLPKQSAIISFIQLADRKLSNTIQNLFGRFVSFEENIDTNGISSRSVWKDVLIFSGFTLFSALFFLSHLQQDYPYIKLNSDAANIASYAAAYDHPELFVGDPALGDPNRFGIYQAINIPLIRFLARYTGNYSLSFILLMFPTVLLFLCSFYLLGMGLFQNRYWAVLFTILNAIPYYLEVDSTGIREPLPRVIFQAIFPFVLLLLWKLKEKPHFWFLVSLSIGLLVFIHPVSTPAWAAALLLGYIALMPKAWSIQRKFGFLVFQGLCIFVAMLPFIVNFSSHQNHSSNIDLSKLHYIYENHFPEGLLDVPGTVKDFVTRMEKNRLLHFSIIAMCILFFLGNRNRRNVWMLILWGIGIFSVSIALPYSERIIEKYLRLPPIEIELLRGIRHYVFLMLLVTVWALSELTRRAKTMLMKYALGAIGVLLLLLVYAGRETRISGIKPALDCIAKGKILCGTTSDLDGVLLFLRDKTPIDSRVFFANNANDRVPLAVRYTSLRPLVYSDKDRGMIYTYPQFATEWYEIYAEFSSHGDAKDWFLKNPEEMSKFAEELGADYLVLDLPNATVSSDKNMKIVYQNTSYTVLSLDRSVP